MSIAKLINMGGGRAGIAVCATLLVFFVQQRLSPNSFTLVTVHHLDTVSLASVESPEDSFKHGPHAGGVQLIAFAAIVQAPDRKTELSLTPPVTSPCLTSPSYHYCILRLQI